MGLLSLNFFFGEIVLLRVVDLGDSLMRWKAGMLMVVLIRDWEGNCRIRLSESGSGDCLSSIARG